MTRPPFPVIPALGLFLVATVALLVRADVAGDLAQVYVLKPLATCLVLAVAASGRRRASGSYRTLVLLGLGASLLGDILLMLPEDRFVLGLAAFLVAHLLYTGAFTRDGGFSAVLATGLPLLAVGLVLGRVLWPALGPLKVPVACYIAVILVMAWQGVERWRLGSHPGARSAGIGALFFLASDATLGLTRFRGAIPGSAAIVLGTYYAAQWFIARSVGKRADSGAPAPS